jgi:tRNA uridine 5-carboxymethylaminomethyl modification enzyme
LAGQINGTSGYEEAGALGLMAGINAARRVQGEQPIVLRRDQAYIGVLIDDLITKETTEPYRMFTSRAEYRLLLRQDNADLRLSKIGFEIGLLPDRNYRKLVIKQEAIHEELNRLATTRRDSFTLAQLLRRPEVRYKDLPSRNDSLSQEVKQQVEIQLKYAGYLDRQEIEIEKFRKMEDKEIPNWIDFNQVPSLRTEARQKLNVVRPATLGQASRISGVSPADVGLIMIWMKRGPQKEPPFSTSQEQQKFSYNE